MVQQGAADEGTPRALLRPPSIAATAKRLCRPRGGCSEGASAPSSIAATHTRIGGARRASPPRALLRPPPLRPVRNGRHPFGGGRSEGASAPSSIAASLALGGGLAAILPPRALLRPPPLRRTEMDGADVVPPPPRALLRPPPLRHPIHPRLRRVGGISEGASAPSSIAAGHGREAWVVEGSPRALLRPPPLRLTSGNYLFLV